MEIAVISDQHLGYGWDTERQDDPFDAFREALEKAADADLILLPGDLFDRKIPKQEVLGQAIDLFRMFEDEQSDITVRDDSDTHCTFRGKPMIAIHGTHERRSGDFLNPIQLLEKAGYLCHIHNERIILEKGDETVAIHGMSGVPERYAPKVLQRFDPEPVPDAYNIFMFHQSVETFVYTDPDQPALKLEHLPDGFDAIIDGHIHWRNLELWGEERPLVIPGSTVTTQMNEIEAEEPKGFLRIDTADDSLTFVELETPRQVFHRDLDVSGMTGSEVRDAFAGLMEDLPATDRKPLFRINITGKTDADISIAELEDQWNDQAFLNVGKKITETTDGGQEIEYEEQDAQEMGMSILTEKTGWDDIEDLFRLLADGKIDEALEELEQRPIEELEGLLTDDDSVEADQTDEESSENDESKKEEGTGLEAYIG